MSKDQAYLLADIGGTHARIAAYENQKIGKPIILKIADFDNPVAMFQNALEKFKLSKPKVAIASAGSQKDKNTWTAANIPHWAIKINAFEKQGLPIDILVNDFYATSYGAIHLSHDDLDILIAGDAKPHGSKVICGPGTGMGLAYADYISEIGNYIVRETYGGHFSMSAFSEEQTLVLRTIRSIIDIDPQKALRVEDVCCGRALPALYEAVCKIHGQEFDEGLSKEILTHKDAPVFEETVRLFHEFLGLFVQTSVITGHALGGVYLDGGVLQFLCDKNLFDTENFKKGFYACPLPSIEEALFKVPVKRIDSNFVALLGLKTIIENQKS